MSAHSVGAFVRYGVTTAFLSLFGLLVQREVNIVPQALQSFPAILARVSVQLRLKMR